MSNVVLAPFTVTRSMGVTTDDVHGGASDPGSGMALPDIPESGSGTHFARRAVGLAFGLFGLIVTVAVLVGLFVEVDVTVDARGTIEPAVIRSVRSPASGVLQEISVVPGDTVVEGALLARLEPTDGGRKGLRSPLHGVVREASTFPAASQLVRRGDALFEVASIDRWRAELIVGERDVGTVQIGDEAKIDVIALQSERKELLHGTVTAISPQPAVIENGTTGTSDRGARPGYRVIIRLDSTETQSTSKRQLRDGYSVSGTIVTRRGRILPLVWRYLRRTASA